MLQLAAHVCHAYVWANPARRRRTQTPPAVLPATVAPAIALAAILPLPTCRAPLVRMQRASARDRINSGMPQTLVLQGALWPGAAGGGRCGRPGCLVSIINVEGVLHMVSSLALYMAELRVVGDAEALGVWRAVQRTFCAWQLHGRVRLTEGSGRRRGPDQLVSSDGWCGAWQSGCCLLGYGLAPATARCLVRIRRPWCTLPMPLCRDCGQAVLMKWHEGDVWEVRCAIVCLLCAVLLCAVLCI